MGAKKVSTGVDSSLTERALRALLKHHESSSDDQQLLGNDLDVQVQFSLARIPGKASAKPIRVEIPHSLVNVGGDGDDTSLQDAQVCIIVKEESKPWVQEMIERFPNELGCVKKVLGLQSLRTKHKSFSQRRELLARFDVFFADDRILPMLTKALGGKFFEKKKQPIPIALTRKEALPFAVQKNLKSTFMFLSAGTCVTVKAGNTGMDATKLLENIQSIAQVVPGKVPRKWANIRSVSIKTSASVALPIYNKTPQELDEIMRLAKEEPEQAIEEEKIEKATKTAKASTPLAKALKKQSSEKDVDSKVEKTPKTKKRKEVTEDATTTSKKKKKKKSDSDIEKIFDENDAMKKTPKSSKKVKKAKKDDDENAAVTKTPKSTKKAKTDSLEGDFVAKKKFVGAKKGYVFTKGKKGLGYYKDDKPVIDTAYLEKLKRGGGGGGGRKSMGQTPRRRKGSSRRSY